MSPFVWSSALSVLLSQNSLCISSLKKPNNHLQIIWILFNVEAFSQNYGDTLFCQPCPAGVVYNITYSTMKTSEKELYWKTTQWLHKLWACAKSIIQHPNENLGRMITFSGRTQTRPVDCGGLRFGRHLKRQHIVTVIPCFPVMKYNPLCLCLIAGHGSLADCM